MSLAAGPDQPLMIQTDALRVDYGDLTAVDNVDLRVAKGEIYGLIGPNGAGKTSTIRVLATLQEPTYGEVRVAGMDIVERRREVQAKLGYMPDFAPVYPDLKVREFLDLFAGAYHVEPRKRRVDEVLELVSLSDRQNVLAGTLSRGLMQRLVLAKTLMHRPSVMLLDEPASGLDPLARIELRDVLKDLSADGVTILISSHILTELSGFCTSIGIMNEGRLDVSGRIEDVIAGVTEFRHFEIRLATPSPRLVEILNRDVNVRETRILEDGALHEIDFSGDDDDAALLLAELVNNELPIFHFAETKLDVEDVFMKVGKGLAPLGGTGSGQNESGREGAA